MRRRDSPERGRERKDEDDQKVHNSTQHGGVWCSLVLLLVGLGLVCISIYSYAASNTSSPKRRKPHPIDELIVDEVCHPSAARRWSARPPEPALAPSNEFFLAEIDRHLASTQNRTLLVAASSQQIHFAVERFASSFESPTLVNTGSSGEAWVHALRQLESAGQSFDAILLALPSDLSLFLGSPPESQLAGADEQLIGTVSRLLKSGGVGIVLDAAEASEGVHSDRRVAHLLNASGLLMVDSFKALETDAGLEMLRGAFVWRRISSELLVGEEDALEPPVQPSGPSVALAVFTLIKGEAGSILQYVK